MRWSWKIGEFAGIGVFVHATFTLLLGWVALAHWMQSRSLPATLDGIAFTLALFGCVVLHEFGHALTARRFGIATRDITLLPIGGVARLERMPDEPVQELWVALAGPGVNVAIAAILYAGLEASGAWRPMTELSVASGPFLQRLLAVNVFLALFNMLPAFPMDGGRVLRALLATRMEYTRATQIAASIGQAMALGFGFLGFFFNPFLLFIALFVWMGAEQEASLTQMRTSLSGIPVTQAMQTDFWIVSPSDPLERAVELILAGSQTDFPVVDDSRVVGILTRADLLAALARRSGATIGDVMQRDFHVVEPTQMLETAFRRLQDCACHTIPVVRNGELVGILTADNLGEFLMIQAALKQARSVR